MNELVKANEAERMTTKELATVLGVDVDTVNNTVKKLGLSDVHRISSGGRPTKVFTEEQATLIKQEIQGHHNLASRQIDNVTTDAEWEILTQKVMAYHVQRYNELMKQMEEQAHKVEFYDEVVDSKDAIEMKNVARVLNNGMGRTKLFEFLRDNKILDVANHPYQQYIDAGYFRLIETKYEQNGETKIYLKTVVTQKGIEYISTKIKSANTSGSKED